MNQTNDYGIPFKQTLHNEKCMKKYLEDFSRYRYFKKRKKEKEKIRLYMKKKVKEYLDLQ